MKKTNAVKLFTTACLLTGLASSSVASADEINSSLLSTSGVSAVDVYRATCAPSGGASTHRLRAAIRDTSLNGGVMSLTLFRDGLAVNTSDVIAADTVQSPFVQLNSGDGQYWLFVSHSQSGTSSYIVEFHCETQNGGHTGTSRVQTQNR